VSGIDGRFVAVILGRGDDRAVARSAADRPRADVRDAAYTGRMSAIVRVGIVGTGWVGSSVAISTLHAGIGQELLLHDLRTDVAEGEAMDLAHGATFYPPAAVRNATLEEMRATDAIVVAAGRGSRPGESRLDLLKDNARTVREIAGRFRDYAGLVIVVTNPVDVLTYEFARTSGVPHQRVIGTGTMLDTARLRQIVGKALHIAPQSVHAQVVGEHGDLEVVLWSSARVTGVPLRHWPEWNTRLEGHLADEVRTAAYEIIRRKGATNHAIGLVTAALLRTLLRGENRVLTVSRVQDGTLGFRDVALSLPAVLGTEGAADVVPPELSQDERERLERSVAVLRQAVAER
jgi:L-lactate dehydrogenase